MRRVYQVHVDLPPGCDSTTMAEYIHNAVASWTGGMDPKHILGCVEIKPIVTFTIRGIPHTVRNGEVFGGRDALERARRD